MQYPNWLVACDRSFTKGLIEIAIIISVWLLIGIASASPIYIAQNDSAQFTMVNSHGTC